MMAVLKDDTELFKQFSDNEGFRRWLSDAIFQATYRENCLDAWRVKGNGEVRYGE